MDVGNSLYKSIDTNMTVDVWTSVVNSVIRPVRDIVCKSIWNSVIESLNVEEWK